MTTVLTFRSDFDVELVDSAGSDARICEAARVSTLGAEAAESIVNAGLLKFLMKNRHGSPFEHGLMTFRISAPIVVWREFMRHRIGFSYNEQSGRYMELAPVFYIPAEARPLVQQGKTGAYDFVLGTSPQFDQTAELLSQSYGVSWGTYQGLLKLGVAKEVARFCLPVAIYSTAYVTCNPRSLMAFLSLRTKSMFSTFKSYPQYEIERVAEQMEALFAAKFPDTHRAFNEFGRVSP